MPAVQPQPVLAPLTPAAIYLVATADDGGDETVHDFLDDPPPLPDPPAPALAPTYHDGSLSIGSLKGTS